MVEPWRRDLFPDLRNYEVTSPATIEYNCVAWIAGDTSRWWDPAASHYWPLLVRDTSIDTFVALFEILSYEKCSGAEVEPGVEKIALYRDPVDGDFSHVAKQLPDGRWSSKLGCFEDIAHEALNDLENPYGSPVVMMRRPNQ